MTQSRTLARSPGCNPSRYVLACALPWLLLSAPANATPLLPASGSPAAVREIEAGLEKIGHLSQPNAQAIDAVRQGCRPLKDAKRCTPEAIQLCRDSVARLFDRLSETRNPQPLTDAYRAWGQMNLANALSRLAHFDGADSCQGQSERTRDRTAHLILTPDRRYGQIVPDRPLDGGVRYAIVARSRNPDLERAKPPIRPIESLPAAAFPNLLDRIDRVRTTALREDLEKTAAALPGQSNLTGIPVAFTTPPDGSTLSELQFSFHPASAAKDRDRLAWIETLDAPSDLRAERQRAQGIPCPAPAPTLRSADLPAGLPSGARALHGYYTSFEISPRPPSGPSVIAADPKVVELPLTLLLPPRFDPKTPLALIVDGHEGSAHRMIERHGKELLEGGLAVLAVDLPGHGKRRPSDEADGFVDIFAPRRLSDNVRQAVVDLVAAIHRATDCGLAIPDEGIYRPKKVRYLGYSLGAMVGWIARASEPRIGTTALLAPGGDLLGWLMLRLGPQLGAHYLSCLGGPAHDQPCVLNPSCPEPGRCVADPFFAQLYRWLERPYSTATASGDPLSFPPPPPAGQSARPLLMITGGQDPVLHPALAARLAAVAGLTPEGRGTLGDGATKLVQWPALGHDLPDHDGPRRQAHGFLISDGKNVAPTDQSTNASPAPWYAIFAPHRERR